MTNEETTAGSRIGLAWRRQHPVVKAMAYSVAAFFITHALIFLFMPPAWAAVSIPLSDRVTINVNMGELLPWAGICVTLIGFYISFRRINEVKVEAGEAKVASLQAVKQTDGVLEKVAALAKKGGKEEERAEVAARKVVARTEAVAEAKNEADIEALKPPPHAETAPVDSKSPLPVADEKVGNAVVRSAEALETSARAVATIAEVAVEKQK